MSASSSNALARSTAWVDQAERYGLIVTWIVLIAVFGWLMPRTFLSWANFSTIFGSQAVLVVVTLGLIIPLTAGVFSDNQVGRCRQPLWPVGLNGRRACPSGGRPHRLE
ncbi:hypothetical protein [Cereibacter changlensis]|uniref:hypothetical protein n=1 Tax=Cereibacter changlensis TaxID=402884 RepID=UPI001B8000EF|nr:hypothetical protein [Cereibacter changlensis]